MTLFDACFDDKPRSEDVSQHIGWAEQWGPQFARDPIALLTLLAEIGGAGEPDEASLVLLARALDDARMNRENAEPGAETFLKAVEIAVIGFSEEGVDGEPLSSTARFGICQAYLRANLPPPEAIRVLPEALEDAAVGIDEILDIAELAGQILPPDVTPWEGHIVLREAVGAMPSDAAEAFVGTMVAQGNARMVATGRYFLLDPIAGFRLAAVRGFELLAEAGGVDAGLLSDLLLLRNWMPEGAALDGAIKTALRREPAGGAVPKPWTIHRLLSSLPDGSGAQSMMAVCSRGKSRAIAALMIKAGHGVKDAYIIPCASRSEQTARVEQIEAAMDFHDVDPAYLGPALARALGDGRAHGMTTAPGLLDMAPMLGLSDLRPEAADVSAYLTAADPDGQIAALTANRRGRLINESAEWVDLHEISDSWFVSDGQLTAELAEVAHERLAAQAIWSHLDRQRLRWAQIFARSAEILRHAPLWPEDWMSFAAVAEALAGDRPLRKIPVFEDIVELTFEAMGWGGPGGFEDFDPVGPESMPFEESADIRHDLRPEGKGELARLLKGSPLDPDQIDGFLTAILIAPEFTSPNEWLAPLMGGIAFPGDDSVQRILDILMLRFNDLNAAILAGDAGSQMRDLSVKRFQSWCKGFSLAVAEIQGAWPKRSVKKDDRKVLDLIRDAGTEDLSATLKPLLPSWLGMAAQRWRMDG